MSQVELITNFISKAISEGDAEVCSHLLDFELKSNDYPLDLDVYRTLTWGKNYSTLAPIVNAASRRFKVVYESVWLAACWNRDISPLTTNFTTEEAKLKSQQLWGKLDKNNIPKDALDVINRILESGSMECYNLAMRYGMLQPVFSDTSLLERAIPYGLDSRVNTKRAIPTVSQFLKDIRKNNPDFCASGDSGAEAAGRLSLISESLTEEAAGLGVINLKSTLTHNASLAYIAKVAESTGMSVYELSAAIPNPQYMDMTSLMSEAFAAYVKKISGYMTLVEILSQISLPITSGSRIAEVEAEMIKRAGNSDDASGFFTMLLNISLEQHFTDPDSTLSYLKSLVLSLRQSPAYPFYVENVKGMRDALLTMLTDFHSYHSASEGLGIPHDNEAPEFALSVLEDLLFTESGKWVELAQRILHVSSSKHNLKNRMRVARVAFEKYLKAENQKPSGRNHYYHQKDASLSKLLNTLFNKYYGTDKKIGIVDQIMTRNEVKQKMSDLGYLLEDIVFNITEERVVEFINKSNQIKDHDKKLSMMATTLDLQPLEWMHKTAINDQGRAALMRLITQ